MKLRLEFSILDFSYSSPIQVKNHLLSSNQALVVNIYRNDLLIKKIDFTALYNFHNYTLIQWKKTLELFFLEETITSGQIILEQPFFNMVKTKKHIVGELLFIIESILFSLIEKEFPNILSSIKKDPIKLNALYNPDSPEISLENLPECIKIKIRPSKSSLDLTLNILSSLKAKKNDICFRLDGNQNFELLDLIDFLSHIKTKNIMYLEEPLNNYNELSSYEKINIFPYALDESVQAFSNNINKIPINYYLILKPSLLGISKCFEIIKNRKDKIVISSTYETISAMTPMMYLAASLPNTFHGFDTLKFLPKNLSTNISNYSLNF